VKVPLYMICGIVATSNTDYLLILRKCTSFWLQKYFLPQRRLSYNDVLSLINSTIL